MGKKKLLYIVESMGGGVFTYIVSLSNEFSAQYEVYIAYGLRKETTEDYLTYFDPKIHMIQVQAFQRNIDFRRDFRAFLEIRRIEKRVKPDIIHLHSSKAGVLGRWAFINKNCPLFYTPHGYSFLMANCNWLKRRIYFLIEWISARGRCVTIACSYGEYLESQKLSKRTEYVASGINLEEMKEILAGAESEKEHNFTVFTLGRIDYSKNPELFNQIAKRFPQVSFLWIGDGELRNQLTEPNIQITGWLDRRKALRACVYADVFLLTSKWEGLPQSLLEAMYMKKLCIVSNCIGNRDVIQNKKNGFICNTPEEFAKAIEYAMAGNGKEQIDQAYQEIETHYNTKVMSGEYCRIYEKYNVKKSV